MSLFICGNDSCYFYFYRFDASSPMVSSSLSPLPSGGKLDPPVRITLSNQVLRSYQVVNRLVPIVDVWMFGSVVSRVQSVDKNHFRHFVLSYKISQALPILSTSRRKKQAYPPLTSPKQCCVTPPAATNESTSVGGGGGVGMVQVVCISELAIWRQCVRWTIFWPICRLYLSCPE